MTRAAPEALASDGGAGERRAAGFGKTGRATTETGSAGRALDRPGRPADHRLGGQAGEQTRTIDPDALALGTMIRELALRVARLERGPFAADPLRPIRDAVIEKIWTVEAPELGVQTVAVRTAAQLVVEQILGGPGLRERREAERREPG